MADTNNAAAPSPKPEKQAEYDDAHVPMTEEFDSAKHTLPNVVPLLIALGVVAVVIGVLAYVLRPKPAATGTIDNIFAIEQSSHTSTFVAVNVTFKNSTTKPLVLQAIKSELITGKGSWVDDAAAAVDIPRYTAAYPDLAGHVQEPLKLQTRIPVGQSISGTVLVSFPTTQADFDQRKSLTVTIYPKDQAAVTIAK